MRNKQILGIGLILVGVAALIASSYIYGQVEEGRGKIATAQSTVDVGDKLLKIDPRFENLGGPLKDKAQSKIDEGIEQANQYESIAFFARAGGILLLISGGVALLIDYNRKNRI